MEITKNVLFKNRYHINSIRLKNYDYSSNGAYFITICTKDREYFFGEIKNGMIDLSKIGKIAKQFWQEIETIHNFIILDEWIIMPNHLHGIIFVQNNVIPLAGRDTPVACLYKNDKNDKNDNNQRKFGQLQKQSIASVINHYKGITQKWANKNKYSQFSWQKNYYEHIIRNEYELNSIREYIFYNPMNWKIDRNNLSVQNKKAPDGDNTP